MPKILFFAGSNGGHSINAKLAQQAAKIAADIGADATLLDLKDYELPLYCSDLEAEKGIPDNAVTLKEMFMAHDGVFIASPEYNSSFSPLLKNTIDWISRVRGEGEPMLPAYKGKVYAIGSTSPGALGGIRGLVPLRMLLGNIGITVVPSQIAVGGSGDAFDESGALVNERQLKMLTKVVKELVDTSALYAA